MQQLEFSVPNYKATSVQKLNSIFHFIKSHTGYMQWLPWKELALGFKDNIGEIKGALLQFPGSTLV